MDELITLQTEKFALTVKGSASHPAFPGVEIREKEASLKAACDIPFELSTAGDEEIVSDLKFGSASVTEYRLRPLFFEQQRYELIIEPEYGHKVEFRHENINIRNKVTPVGKRAEILSGVIDFGNDIGMSDLEIWADGKSCLKLTVEVFPSKISYKEDYKAIVADITAEIYNLIFDFLKKTYDAFDISSVKKSSPVEFFAIIRRIYGKFLTAANMVLARPHHLLETEHTVMYGHKIQRTDGKTLRWLEKHPDRYMLTADGVNVEKALAARKYVTYDTKENRLTKYMLKSTVKRLESFDAQYRKIAGKGDPKVTEQIASMIKGLRRCYETGVLKDIESVPSESGMSLVFGMAPGYRELFRCYLLLKHGLSVTGNVFHVSEKDLAVLYEYWCFIKLNSLMKDRYELISQDIIKTNGSGLSVTLLKGQRSLVRYRNPKNGEQIALSYNPKEISGATVAQKPDNVLSLKKKGSKIDYEYVFDAKYRINPAPEGSTYRSTYKTPGPQEDDINTMHRYRDAIVFQKGAFPFERTMFGAYVLFPYRDQEEYRNHRFYKSIEQVNIGGLPFLPSATDLVTEMLDELISDSPESAFERASLPNGIEERLAKVDWSRRDVLVGTLRSNEQYQACLKHNFYYIPASFIKDENLPVHYVALYRTTRIFPDNAGIDRIGEVLRCAQVRRKDIREVPLTRNNPDEFYYRFSVREWETTEKRILPRESGFTHAFTNRFLMDNSEYVPELLLRSEEEYRLYTELKRHTGTALKNDASVSGFELGSIRALFSDSRISVFQNGKQVFDCAAAEFAGQPNAVFRKLQRRISTEVEEKSYI